MVAIEDGAAIIMAGEMGPAAFVDIRSIGVLDDQVNRGVSATVCSLLSEQCGISPERIYINFTDFDASFWGWNNSTFG